MWPHHPIPSIWGVLSFDDQHNSCVKEVICLDLCTDVLILVSSNGLVMCCFSENDNTPPTEVFLVWTPPPLWNSSLASYFPFKILAFEIPPPSPSKYPITLLEMAMDIIQNCTIQTKWCDQADYVIWCTLLYYKQILLCNNAFQCSALGYCLSLPPTPCTC